MSPERHAGSVLSTMENMSAKKTNKRTIWKFTFYILSFVIMPTTHETRTEVTCQGASYSCKAHPKKSQPQAVQRLCPQPPRAKLQERRGRQSGFGESATTVLGVVGEHDGRSPGPTTPGIKPGHRTHETGGYSPSTGSKQTEASKQPGQRGGGPESPWEYLCGTPC